MKLSILSTAVATVGLAMAASSANAAMTTDSHGNVGYDSYDECVAAVKDGSARFYTPYTTQSPKRWAGETSVTQSTLGEVTIPADIAADMPLRTREYSAGACDLGVGQSNGRYGVSGELVGKYVPFSPDMPVNVYMNRNGDPVRITMQQCDNHFGAKFPTPVISEMKAPEPQVRIAEARSVEPVTTDVRRTIRQVPSSAPVAVQPAPVVRQPPVGYEVKEVLVVPSDQVHRIETQNGTQIAIQNENNEAIVIGEKANPAILNEAENSVEEVPVIEVAPVQ